MRICPECGTENLESDDYCKKCMAPLVRKVYTTVSTVPASPSQPPAQDTPATQADVQALHDEFITHRTGLAGVLSAIYPGLGLVYAGATGAGLAVMLGWAIGVFLYVRWCLGAITTPSVLYPYEPAGLGGIHVGHVVVGLIMLVGWAADVFISQEAARGR